MMSNRVEAERKRRGWTQAYLAEQAGVSRTAVSAIEGERLIPSVAAALAIARVFETSVEHLFGPTDLSASATEWAWAPAQSRTRYWTAEIGGRVLAYPCETTALGEQPHDAIAALSACPVSSEATRQTLVIAGCDPCASLLATMLFQNHGVRVLPLLRSSRQALDLLQRGVVHAAGVHLAKVGDQRGNAGIVAATMGEDYRLLRLAEWEAGITIAAATPATSVRAVVRSRLRWVGREPGSGARQCLDELFPKPREFRRIAFDHRGVAEAIRSGWADVGVSLRLVSEQARQQFLPLRWESYDLCFPATLEQDPRIKALVATVRSAEFRNLLQEVPGYSVQQTGDLAGT